MQQNQQDQQELLAQTMRRDEREQLVPMRCQAIALGRGARQVLLMDILVYFLMVGDERVDERVKLGADPERDDLFRDHREAVWFRCGWS